MYIAEERKPRYTPTRYQMLRDVADGKPDVGLTDSTVMTLLVNAGLIHAGFIYRITPAGAELLSEWEPIHEEKQRRKGCA